MINLVIFPLAAKDIKSIYDYVSVELANPIAANNFIDDLNDTFQKMVMFPKMYPIMDNPFIKDKAVRKALVKSYLAF